MCFVMVYVIKEGFELVDLKGKNSLNCGRWRHFYGIGGTSWWLCGGGVGGGVG